MFEDLKKYINNRILLTKLEIVDSVSNMLSNGIFVIVAIMFFMLVFFTGSLAIGYLLGNLFDNNGMGFLILFIFYLILFLVFLYFRKKIIMILTDKTIEAAMDAIDNSENYSEDEDRDTTH